MVGLSRLGILEFSPTIVIMFINIGILYLILKKFLFKPVTEFMEKRTKGIEDSIKDAEDKVKEAEEYKASYLAKLNTAENESKEIVDKAISNANQKAENILNEAKKEANALKDKAERDIELERKKAFNDAKNEISSIAMLAASKIIESEIDQKKNEALVDKFIEEVGEVKWQS